MTEPVLELWDVRGLPICSACLDGEGGECHTPGYVFWCKHAPDVPIRGFLRDVGGRKVADEREGGP